MRSMLFHHIPAVALLLIMVTGCGQRFEDISHSDSSKSLIGREYIVREILMIHGITTDANYRGGVDYYSVSAPPGSGGPEILERRTLELGTRLRVERVIRCTNCLFMNDIVVVVQVPELELLNREVRLKNLAHLDRAIGVVKMDQKYFREVN